MPQLRVLLHCLLLSSFLCLTACSSTRTAVPVGEIPAARTVSVSDEQYGHKVLQQLTKRFEVDYDDARLNDIIDAVERLTKAAGADKDPWHIYLFKAPKIKNAAVTRGNHLFFWSGMFDAIESEDEMAAILAHEIAHVMAGHTDPDPNEQVKKMLIQLGAMAAGIAVASTTGNANVGANLGRATAALTQQLANGVLVNPYSQELELEADHVGLMILSEAKYNPEAALKFWERAQREGTLGGGSSAFFSTHPLASSRLESLRKALPQAWDRYHGRSSKKPFNLSTTSHSHSNHSHGELEKTKESEKTAEIIKDEARKGPDSNKSSLETRPEYLKKPQFEIR